MIVDKVKWGIIGCGDVTEVKSGPAFQKAANSELVAVMRRNGALAADYARRHGVPRWYDDADALINDPAVNAIYVATPPSTHADYAIRAMRAGKPVYVEKPMALNADECRDMVDVSQYTGVPLFVAYYRRALPMFVKLKGLIDMEAIGEVRMINVTLHLPAKPEELQGTLGWRVDPAVSGGGHFHDLASHQLDYLEYIFGKIVEAKGVAVNQAGLYATEDTVSASFRFASGIIGSGSWCFVVPKKQAMDVTEIIGSRGRISFSFFSNTILHVETDTMVEDFDIPNPPHVHQPLVELVVNELRGHGKCPSTGETGLSASLLMDEIMRK
ncbi:MAG: Gfo/Idh/MocA family oxidoreductase [Cyclobacteriaceae bacterium]|nr:Gfo/Idh/MocA family oxidoreductase [Cyclobacteriaceae bacterium]